MASGRSSIACFPSTMPPQLGAISPTVNFLERSSSVIDRHRPMGSRRNAMSAYVIARDPEHWRNLLTPDYRRVGPVYDQALREAAFGRLRPRVDGGLGQQIPQSFRSAYAL